LPSDDLLSLAFSHSPQNNQPAPSTPPNQSHWDLLENRVNRLMENIILLRDINAQLKKENEFLKEELKNIHQSGSQQELANLRRQYDEALEDLKQVKQNLQKIESLANALNLEGY
jgi:predicted RNase H-like nuclease (RuvC/YqgF family)